MTYVLISASILCGWAVLSILGGERTRRLRDVESAASADDAPAPPAAPSGGRS